MKQRSWDGSLDESEAGFCVLLFLAEDLASGRAQGWNEVSHRHMEEESQRLCGVTLTSWPPSDLLSHLGDVALALANQGSQVKGHTVCKR